MPAKDDAETEAQVFWPPNETHPSEAQMLLRTLDRVFSTFREQLQTEVPKPFTGNAKIAADTFNDILGGLGFEPGRPGSITIEGTNVSPTEIELRWTDGATSADGYRVERCQGRDCEDLDEIAPLLPSTARSFRDANLHEGVFYRYRVVAFDARGQSASNIVGLTVQDPSSRPPRRTRS